MTSSYSAHIYNVKVLHFRFSDALSAVFPFSRSFLYQYGVSYAQLFVNTAGLTWTAAQTITNQSSKMHLLTAAVAELVNLNFIY